MPDGLDVIQQAITEHDNILVSARGVDDGLNDIQAFFSLQQEAAAWSQTSIEALGERRARLQQAMARLVNGLKTHFAYEEEHLPPLLGPVLAKALKLDHQEIQRRLENIDNLLTSTHPETLALPELFSLREKLWQAITDARQYLERHSRDEDAVFKLLAKSLAASS